MNFKGSKAEMRTKSHLRRGVLLWSFGLSFFLAGLSPDGIASTARHHPTQVSQGLFVSDESVLPEDFHLEFQTQWGLGRSPFQDGASSPTINQMSLGLTAGIRPFSWLVIGGSTDLRWTGQFSDILSSIGGVRGHRFNPFSPTLALTVDEFTIKAEYELLGSHHFTNQSQFETEDVTYRTPRGFRVGLSRPIYRRMIAGVSYESLSFESKEGDAGVPARENLWMMAFTAGWVF